MSRYGREPIDFTGLKTIGLAEGGGTVEGAGREMNRAIAEGAGDGIGMGEALGRTLDRGDCSLLYGAYQHGTPVTVHVAIGTDTPHTHPAADAAAIGAASHHDFRLFCSLVAEMNGGGVYLNVDSAVVLPGVVLKAISTVRNLGTPLAELTTINL